MCTVCRRSCAGTWSKRHLDAKPVSLSRTISHFLVNDKQERRKAKMKRVLKSNVASHCLKFYEWISLLPRHVPLCKIIPGIVCLAMFISGCDAQWSIVSPKEVFHKMVECQRTGDFDGFLACLDEGRFVAELRDKTRDPELKRMAADEMKNEIDGCVFWVAEEKINGDRAFLAVEGKNRKKGSSHLLGVPLVNTGWTWKIRVEELVDSDSSTVRKKMNEWLRGK